MNGWHWEDIALGWGLLSQGIATTLGMALVIGLSALLLGVVLGVLRHEGPLEARWGVGAFVELIRSIPLILFLAFIHFGAMSPLNRALGWSDNPLFSAVVGMALFEAAYFAEIIRGGMVGLRATERDAARSLGLTYFQRLRYVFLPLVFSRTMPALIGQTITLIKDTSLASVLGVLELTRQAQIIYENTYHPAELLLFVALVYFGVCFALSVLGRRLEPPQQVAGPPVSRLPAYLGTA